MFVTDVKKQSKKGFAELSALFVPEKPWHKPRRIWWRVPAKFAEVLETSGDPLFAAALPLAMLEGKRLKIEAAVSARLFQSAQYIQGLYHTWVPGAQQIPIETKVEQHPAGGSGVGCFFSGGVDSFYTLLKNGALPEGHPDRLTHLVFVAGFDLPLTNHTLLRQTRASLDRVATASDCQLLEVQTNLRALSDPWLTWGFYHGAALASVGLACGSLFRKLLIPSSFALKGQIHPWGSHPELDPLWSTERTEYIHDGGEALRCEKIIDWICHSDLALQNLRVCWKNYHHRYNCGICEKCVRTMLSLHVGTGKFNFPTFAKPLTVKSVKHLKLNDQTQLIFARENADYIRKSPYSNPALLNALNYAIQQGENQLYAKNTSCSAKGRSKSFSRFSDIIKTTK